MGKLITCATLPVTIINLGLEAVNVTGVALETIVK